jgi:hypothetical protein
MIEDMSDFRALDTFFRAIEQGLAGFVYSGQFSDLLAQDVVFDFIITVPNYPGHVVGRADLIELYRGYGSTFFLDRCYDLRVHHSPSTSSVVLEYFFRGKGRPHRAAVQQPIHFRCRHQRPQSHRVARLPRPTAGPRRPRGTPLRTEGPRSDVTSHSRRLSRRSAPNANVRCRSTLLQGPAFRRSGLTPSDPALNALTAHHGLAVVEGLAPMPSC